MVFLKELIRVIKEDTSYSYYDDDDYDGDWDLASEQEQIDFVKENGMNIHRIKNPSDAVQLAAYRNDYEVLDYLIEVGARISQDVINKALTSRVTMNRYLEIPHNNSNPYYYPDLVKRLYPNNELMQRKWMRYWEANRNKQ